MKTLCIKRIQIKDFYYYEATFNNNNLLTFSINEMINQLCTIYGFKFSLFEFNLN
jgi:hypothetical protein